MAPARDRQALGIATMQDVEDHQASIRGVPDTAIVTISVSRYRDLIERAKMSGTPYEVRQELDHARAVLVAARELQDSDPWIRFWNLINSYYSRFRGYK